MERTNQSRGSGRPLRPKALEMPAGLAGHEKLGVAAKLAGAVLWNDAGRQPNTICITYEALADAVGRNGRRAREWVAELKAAGFAQVLDKTRRGLRIYINDPDQVVSELRCVSALADPQGLLFETENPPAEAADHRASVVSLPGERAVGRQGEYPHPGLGVGIDSAEAVPKPPSVTVPQPPTRNSPVGDLAYPATDSAETVPFPPAEMVLIPNSAETVPKPPAEMVPKPPTVSLSPDELRGVQALQLLRVERGRGGRAPPTDPAETVPFPPGTPFASRNLNSNSNTNSNSFKARFHQNSNSNERVGCADAARALDERAPAPIGAALENLNLNLDERAGSAQERVKRLIGELDALCRRCVELVYRRRGKPLPNRPPEVGEQARTRVARAIVDGMAAGEMGLDLFIDALNSAVVSETLVNPVGTPFYIIGAWQKIFDRFDVPWGNRPRWGNPKAAPKPQ
jgi:hypothetical protein